MPEVVAWGILGFSIGFLYAKFVSWKEKHNLQKLTKPNRK